MSEEWERDRLARLASADLNLLAPLVALLEERSVTRAAHRVGLSQPAMSHLLRRARKLFGDELLIRAGSTYAVTPRAEQLLEVLTDVLTTVMDDVLGLPPFEPLTDRRTITMSASTTISFVVGPPLLTLVQERAPGITVRFEPIDHAPLQNPFVRDELDVVLLPDVIATTHPRERLYDDRWVGVVARSNPRVGPVLSAADLSALDHLRFDGTTAPYAAMHALGIGHRQRALIHDFLLIPHLVSTYDGIAIVQERVARRLAGPLELRLLELPFTTPTLGIDLVWNPRLRRDPARTWLRELLREATEKPPA